MPVDLRDLYMLIGEREVIRYYQQERIKCLEQVCNEQQVELTKYRMELERGKLEQSSNNDPIRPVPSGGEGA